MTDNEARQVLESPSADSSQRPNRRSSGAALPATRRGAPRTPSARKPLPEVAPSPSYIKFVVPAIAVIVVAVGGWLTLSGSGTPTDTRAKKARKRQSKTKDPAGEKGASGKSAELDARQQPAPGPMSASKAPQSGPAPKNGEKRPSAQEAFDQLYESRDLAADDWDGRLARADAFLKTYPDSILCARVRHLRRQWLIKKNPPPPPVKEPGKTEVSKTSSGSDSPSGAAGGTALFNGKDLSGWPQKSKTIHVDNGEIVFKGNRGYVVSLFRYNCLPRDFELTMRARGDRSEALIGFSCSNWDVYTQWHKDGRLELSERNNKRTNKSKILGKTTEKVPWGSYLFRITVIKGNVRVYVDQQLRLKADSAAANSHKRRHLYLLGSIDGRFRIKDIRVRPAK